MRRALPLLALVAAGCGDGDLPQSTADAAPTVVDAAPASDGAPASDPQPAPDALPGNDAQPTTNLYGPDPFAIVLWPDTQFYIQSYPDMFQVGTEWIVAQKEALGLAFVLHMGDIVQTAIFPSEWTRADGILKLFEAAGVPYAVCAGNHDMDVRTRDTTQLNQTFPPTRFPRSLQATFEPNKIDNAYYFFPAGGRTWLVMSLEFGPTNEAVAWADGIIAANAEKPTILLTHAYMYLGHDRYDKAHHPDQFWNPHDYAMPGTTNDGQELWDKLVSKHDNVLFVFSGHATWPEGAAGRLSTKRANGYYVHEMLSNYQGCPVDDMCMNRMTNRPVRGGEGMIRILHIDPPHNVARVETYSPYLDKTECMPAFSSCPAAHHAEPEHQFEVPLQ